MAGNVARIIKILVMQRQPVVSKRIAKRRNQGSDSKQEGTRDLLLMNKLPCLFQYTSRPALSLSPRGVALIGLAESLILSHTFPLTYAIISSPLLLLQDRSCSWATSESIGLNHSTTAAQLQSLRG